MSLGGLILRPRSIAVVAIAVVGALSVAALAGPPSPRIKASLIAPGSDVLFFGDSWTYGYNARPLEMGFAYDVANTLDLNATINGLSGTGYIDDGPNDEGTFADRLRALELPTAPALVFLQGGTNDTESWRELKRPAAEVVDLILTKWPETQIVMMGPASSIWPAAAEVDAVDDQLIEVARDLGIPYISPSADGWLNKDTFKSIIDRETGHPSTEGHAILAERVVDELRKMVE